MKIEVDCYAGYKADEKPRRFRLHGHEYLVGECLDRWHGPDHEFFKVLASDGNTYILRHQTSIPNGGWELVSYRSSGKQS